MTRDVKLILLAGVTLAIGAAVLNWPHIPQRAAYHDFCDDRRWLGIPNFANIVSNIVFLFAGIAGFLSLNRTNAAPVGIKLIYWFVFAGFILTAFGSAYYHFSPDNTTLLSDRLPMTVVFMGLLAAVVAEGIGMTAGLLAIGPLLAGGAASVVWWYITESDGAGDLRLYVLVQYYPFIAIPMILLLFPSPAIRRGWPPLLWAIAWYAVAKVTEAFDCPLYAAIGVSGHTLKHLAAGVSTLLLVKRFRVMYKGRPDRGSITDW